MWFVLLLTLLTLAGGLGEGAQRRPDPAFAVNITVFHVNQATFGMVPLNMDTADLRGDMYFDLRGVILPLECKKNNSASAHDCDNAEVVSTDLVINKLVLEVDSRYGVYGRCNVCVNGSDHHGDNNCTDGKYVCSCGDYRKPKPCDKSVGMENVTLHSATRKCQDGDPDWLCWRDTMAKKTGGAWFSTTEEGYCGSNSGTGACTWRVALFVKRINKTCSDRNIYRTVEDADETDCFEACKDSGRGPARNTSSPCWISCFYETVLGPDASRPGGSITGMQIDRLQTAWEQPFMSEDPARGGCASLPTLL